MLPKHGYARPSSTCSGFALYWVAWPLNMVSVGVPAAISSGEVLRQLVTVGAVLPCVVQGKPSLNHHVLVIDRSRSAGSIMTAPCMPLE